jgi:uncharacterized protein (TIGR02588 family)
MRHRGTGGELAPPSQKDADRRGSPAYRGHSVAEWSTLTISGLLILGLVGLVISLSVSGGHQPPRIEVTAAMREIRYEEERYYLPITVTNHGDEAAQEVRIRADLVTSDETSETAEFTIDVLAGGETAEGTVVFAMDPAATLLSVAVESFR